MEQLEVLAFAIRTLEQLRLPYMIVGSYGSMAYGEIRSTRDIDIVVAIALHDVPPLAAAFQAEPGFYLYEPSIAEAVRTRSQFNIIHVASGNKIDFILPRDDAYGVEQLSRRQRIFITRDLEGYTASPEDIVLGKLWYYSLGGSEKHLTDIAAIWKSRPLDVAYIDRWAPALGAADAWRALRERLEGAS